MNAYVDESLRQGPSGICVVVAALVAPAEAERTRRRMRSLLLKGQKRFHWREESDPKRAAMIDACCGLPVVGIAYACLSVDRNRQERARVRCLERMLWD
ncbi:MAG: hypothetical protein ACRDL8_17390, partial [Solirubrobacteraceae bacterium]